MLLNVLVANKVESNLLIKFTDDIKLREIINTKRVESSQEKLLIKH